MKRYFLAVSIALLLTACGGGSGNSSSTAVPNTLPATAAPTANATPTAKPAVSATATATATATAAATATPTPAALVPFTNVIGRAAVTANSPATSGVYVQIPGRGEIFASLGNSSANAVFSYDLSPTIPAGLPAFDATKTVIGSLQITSDTTVTLTGPLAIALNPADNGAYTSYQLAYLDASNIWHYGIGANEASNSYTLTVGASGNTYNFPAGVTATIVLYAN